VQAVGTVDVQVGNPSGLSPAVTADQFVYTAATGIPTVTGVSPTSGVIGGGTAVTITGTNFTEATAVFVGDLPATMFNVNSAASITAQSAPQAAGVVDITVATAQGISAAVSGDQFTYNATAPTVTGVAPNSGPAAGGTQVVVTGTNFLAVTAVTFGMTAATAYSVDSATQITATAPALGAGSDHITVTTSVATSGPSGADQFTAMSAPAPTVTSVRPTSGPMAGGTTVVITGTDFTSASQVAFGTVNATSYTVDSPTQITATSPSQVAGDVDVTVTTPSGVSPINDAHQFSYLAAAPAVTSISPTSGATSGGTAVTITGTNFTGAYSVLFGSTPALTIQVNSDTSITAVSPLAPAGTVDITVTTFNGVSAFSLADQFTYTSGAGTPSVTSLSPSSGPASGGTAVTITGTGLTGAIAVMFGDASAEFTVVSATQIDATAPFQVAGTVDVTVTTYGGVSALGSSDQYTYTSVAPTVTGISPNSGLTSGGDSVTITGTGFTGAIYASFGSVTTYGLTVTSDTVDDAVHADRRGRHHRRDRDDAERHVGNRGGGPVHVQRADCGLFLGGPIRPAFSLAACRRRSATGRAEMFCGRQKVVDIGERIADSEWACITILARREFAMFRLLRSITLRQCFTEQIPALAGAAVTAELFYKFHSFLLECGAFLATWFVLDLVLQGVAWSLAGKKLAARGGQGTVVPLLLCFAVAMPGCREATPSRAVPDGATPTPRAAVGTGQTPPLCEDVVYRPSVTCVALSPDGKLGLSIMGDIMTLWSLPGGKAVRRFEPLPKDPLPDRDEFDLSGNVRYGSRIVYQLAVNWEHRIAATGDGNGLLRVWNLTTGALMREIQGTERKPDEGSLRSTEISALALSADGARVYSSGTELHPPSSVKVWDVKTGKLLQRIAPFKPGSGLGYKGIFLLKNGQEALLNRVSYYALWDLTQDKCIWERQDSNGRLFASTQNASRLLTHSDRNYVVRGSNGEQLRVLSNLPRGKDLPGHYSQFAAFIPCEQSGVVSAGGRGELSLWDVDEDKTLAEYKGSSLQIIMSLAVSADGRYALTGRTNAVLQLWDLHTGKVVQIAQ
jgi:hypothetical protein